MRYIQYWMPGFLLCFNNWLPLINLTGHVMAGDQSFYEELLNMRCQFVLNDASQDTLHLIGGFPQIMICINQDFFSTIKVLTIVNYKLKQGE